MYSKKVAEFFMSSSKLLVSPAGVFRGVRFSSLTVGNIGAKLTGTPNENIVQKHLNTALLNVFQYLNDR